jgi:DNA polymerase-3 subunit delta'
MYGFREIIGHEQIINNIKSVIKTKKISHSYIIEGERGLGKKLISNSFAKTLQCENGLEDCCNICTSCKMYESSNHPDVKYVKATKKSGLGVDDIREQINKDINIKPYKYDYKIYIVDNADTMTIQAQNALLKTIEEPPNYAIIILLAENIHRFLQTILSRCVLIQLKPIETDKINNYLINNIKIPDYNALIYAKFSRGNIGRAIELSSSSEFITMRDKIIEIINVIIKADEYDILQTYEIFLEYKDSANTFLDLMVTWLRDLLIIKKINDEGYLIHGDKYKTILKQAQLLSYNKICMLIDNIGEVQKQLKVNVNYQLSIETMLLN